jgi:hypothetical protein
MATKICIKCGIEKSVDYFNDATGKNIKTPKKINTCKVCSHRLAKERTKLHYEEKKTAHSLYLENHPIETKVCRICKKELPLKDFVFHATKADLMSSECRICRLKYTKERALKNKTKIYAIDKTVGKVCRQCGIEKTLEDFNLHFGNKDLHRHECRACQKENQQKHYPLIKDEWNERRRAQKDDPVIQQKRHHQHLKRNFGITREDYRIMLHSQNGSCAICGSDKPGINGKTIKNFAVDHDHATGKVRALLCENCNQGLGNFLDKPTLLRQAAEYLDSFNRSI